MRDRLIDLIDDKPFTDEYQSYNSGEWAEHFADYLIDNGVILPPCKIGATVWVIPTKENGLEDITEMRCLGFEISEPCPVVNLFDWKNKLYQPSFDQFGISVFTDIGEAAHALGVMRLNNYEMQKM